MVRRTKEEVAKLRKEILDLVSIVEKINVGVPISAASLAKALKLEYSDAAYHLKMALRSRRHKRRQATIKQVREAE